MKNPLPICIFKQHGASLAFMSLESKSNFLSCFQVSLCSPPKLFVHFAAKRFSNCVCLSVCLLGAKQVVHGGFISFFHLGQLQSAACRNNTDEERWCWTRTKPKQLAERHTNNEIELSHHTRAFHFPLLTALIGRHDSLGAVRHVFLYRLHNFCRAESTWLSAIVYSDSRHRSEQASNFRELLRNPWPHSLVVKEE